MKHKVCKDAYIVEENLMKKLIKDMCHFVKKKKKRNNLNNLFKKESE